jgi:ATP-dependent Clp protease ATP-binding subunit ClpC
VGTEHLLLGLLREGEGIAVDDLARLAVSPERAREETLRVLSERPPDIVVAGRPWCPR